MNPSAPHAAATHLAVEQAGRASYGRLVAWLAARWHDVAAVEDALSVAFAAALRTWPQSGVPDKPESWLLAAAHRRLVDGARHQRVRAEAAGELAARLESPPPHMPFPDERLPLLFVCAHPAIAEETRAPLMLQTVLGLDAARIAAAWLVEPTAMGQRLVRAKTKIREAGIRFQLPEHSELPARLEAVLEAIYAAYGTGWDEIEGGGPASRGLAEEALWLARALVELLPNEPEALGLLALLLHCEARRSARRSPAGHYVPLLDQDPQDWSRPLIEEAERTLAAAAALRQAGRFQWHAAIQSAHAARRVGGRTDWTAIVLLYGALLAHSPTLGAQVAQVAAVAEAHGCSEAWQRLEQLPRPVFARYQPFWALRAHLLARLGWTADAREAYDHAIQLCADPAVGEFLRHRQSTLG